MHDFLQGDRYGRVVSVVRGRVAGNHQDDRNGLGLIGHGTRIALVHHSAGQRLTAESAPRTDLEEVERKPGSSAESVGQPAISATRSEVELILANLGVVTEGDLERFVENPLGRLARLMKSDRVKTVETTFEDAL